MSKTTIRCGECASDRLTDPLDTIEHEANQTLAQISKLREIDLKQAEIDELIEAQNKRIEEYEKGAKDE